MKKLRKLLCAGMAALTMASMSLSASAASSTYDDSDDVIVEEFADTDFVLVSEEEIVYEDGMVAEVKAFIEDGAETLNYSGQKKYRCEANFKNTIGTTVVTLWVEGTFHWNSSTDRAYVDDDANGGCSHLNGSFKYVSEELKQGSDQGGLFLGKKYAYIEITYVYRNNKDVKLTDTLSFDVNVNGDWHWSTKHGTNDVTVKEVN